MDAKLWVGLDVGAYRTSICITDDTGEVVLQNESPTNPTAIFEVLEAHDGIAAVSMETGASPHLARKLRSAGLPVIVFDAFKASRYLTIRRNKTDANDARGMAEIGRLGRSSVSEVSVRNLECQTIRSKLKLRRGLSDQRRGAESLIRSLLHLHGRHLPRTYSADALCREALELATEIAANEKVDVTPEIDPLLELAATIRRFENRLGLELERLARKSPECRRLMTIPGIGPICALSFYSTIENPFRFNRVADVGAYLGLAPRVGETGGKRSRARISKAGDPMTRANLYMAAQVVLSNVKRDCAIVVWGKQLRERVGAKRAKVALARKLAITMAAVWKSGAGFKDYPSGAYSN